MNEWFFSGNLPWFSVPALIATILFLIRIGFMLVGDVGDADLGDGDAGDFGDGDAAHDPSDAAFKVLSIQVISAFLMGFGWGGFATLRSGLSNSVLVAIVVGVVFGVAMAWFLMVGLKAVYSLQSSGNVSMAQAVGTQGTVYLRVPPRGEGAGSVQVVIDGRQRIYNARTEGEEIPRGASVKITKSEGGALTVVRA
ncbi:MAG: NfeD family protein [Phycisphaeraceae bacterium]|nr:NfeD family protein [Phycisphaeraceae bacterium]